MKFQNLPKLIQGGNYSVNVSWRYLEEHLSSLINPKSVDIAALDIDPLFQRGHVWTKEQQIKYVEFKLAGGCGSNVVLFNCPGWMNSFKGPFVLVDGKQRLEAVRSFMDNKITAFGYYYKDFTDPLRLDADFIFQVNDLQSTNDVLKWYLQLNSYGTPHTEDELNKVRDMMTEK